MDIRTGFLQKLTLNIPLCCTFVSRCLVALRTMEIPSLLYCVLVQTFSLYFLLCVPIWSTLCSLGADQIEITVFRNFVAVLYQSLSMETWLLSRCIAADVS
jgi:hypothetical protein